jgi:cell wall-associated NlpC family hydrolase
VTTFDALKGRPAATRRPFRVLRFFLAAAFLGLAFPALAQEAIVPGIGLENISAAANAVAAQPASTGDRAPFASDAVAQAQPVASSATDADKPGNGVQTLLKRALALLGTPYRWGGTATNGFDCSGLVGYVFKTALGIELPRVSRDMANTGQRIERSALTAGDIVFFKVHGKRVDHVGIYVGNGQFLHAPSTGKDVMVSRLDQGYWSGKFMEARRVAGL